MILLDTTELLNIRNIAAKMDFVLCSI